MQVRIPILILMLSFLVFYVPNAQAQSVAINEIMSSNAQTFADEDGEFPDWIELYNYGTQAIDLTGFGLSDSETEPLKWIFPQFILQPQQYLLVCASGKDRANAPLHWETVITKGDNWSYFVGTQAPPANWNLPQFDASAWSVGASGFGYGDDDDATIIPSTLSCFVRKEFQLTDTSNISEVFLHIDYDDGFVAYLNGVVIAWQNMNYLGTPPLYNETATNYTEPLLAFGNPPASFHSNEWRHLLKTGSNVLAIQVHNSSTTSSDITLIPFLTLGMKTPPQNPRGVSPLIKFSAPRLHTNFKIDAEGETIYLSDAQGKNIDYKQVSQPLSDISLGRKPDGTGNWFYFEESTPESINNTSTTSDFAGLPSFSTLGGFYSGTVQVTITPANADETIYYTINGSEPDVYSTKYTSPISIFSTTVIRAKAFATNKFASKTISSTYFINVNKKIAIVSLSTKPANLFDWNTGIYELGPNAETADPHFGANYWQDWEIGVNLEIYNKEKELEMNSGAGAKIYGAWSRASAQKSLAFFARKQYGASSFNIKLFPTKPIEKFEGFILRNSGNDWMHSMFRDAMMTSLVSNMNIDYQAYRPAVLYINGTYWGIQNFREKINEHFIKDNHKNVQADALDIVEANSVAIQGDAEHYNAMLQTVGQPSFDFNYVKTLIDVDNYIDYQLSQIYIDNTDWPGNNIKYWRPRTETGKWRWIMYDTDFGFGMYNATAYYNNTLAFALQATGSVWPNPEWSTFLFRNLLKNIEFRNLFINRFADMLNTTFLPQRVNQHIDSLANGIRDEIAFHMTRWSGNINDWQASINTMKSFATYRPYYMRNYIQSQFNISGTAKVNLEVYPANTGIIKINTIYPEQNNWEGVYFKGIPIRVIAQAPAGYKFIGWSGNSTSEKDSLQLTLTSDISLTAHFEVDTTNAPSIVINEINYNSSSDVNTGDWIELHNTSSQSIDLSNWIFKDSDDSHSFVLPQKTILKSKDYLVLCNDTVLFKEFFPNITQRIGNFSFGLSSEGELIRLYNAQNKLIDSVVYDVKNQWSYLPNGNGPTLELKKPWLDNALGKNWDAKSYFGTPGKANTLLTGIDDLKLKQDGLSAYPTPFSDFTTLNFNLQKSDFVRVEVFDATGKVVSVLLDAYLPAGNQSVEWNGTDSNNNRLPNGLFIFKLSSSDSFQTLKTLLIRE